MTGVIGWMTMVSCLGCGTRGDWSIKDQTWTCSCGRPMHASPTADNDVQLNVRRMVLARIMVGELML